MTVTDDQDGISRQARHDLARMIERGIDKPEHHDRRPRNGEPIPVRDYDRAVLETRIYRMTDAEFTDWRRSTTAAALQSGPQEATAAARKAAGFGLQRRKNAEFAAIHGQERLDKWIDSLKIDATIDPEQAAEFDAEQEAHPAWIGREYRQRSAYSGPRPDRDPNTWGCRTRTGIERNTGARNIGHEYDEDGARKF